MNKRTTVDSTRTTIDSVGATRRAASDRTTKKRPRKTVRSAARLGDASPTDTARPRKTDRRATRRAASDRTTKKRPRKTDRIVARRGGANSTGAARVASNDDASDGALATIGIDLGDRVSHVCHRALDGTLTASTVRTTPAGLEDFFVKQPRSRVVFEVGTHAPWIKELAEHAGHEVFVANPRRLRLIAASDTKSDRSDAQLLARLGHADPHLLAPVKLRGTQAVADRAVLRARDLLVKQRVQTITMLRSLTKSVGGRLPQCSTAAFATRVAEAIPEVLRPAATGLLESIARLTEQIAAYDREIAALAERSYPETALLRQVPGVGPVTALTFVLTIDDVNRFAGDRRTVGAYLGLVPRRRESGQQRPQLPITKAGDTALRRLLVQAAHYHVGTFNKTDSTLRQWALKRAPKGCPSGLKRRVIVAVARKLAVLLVALWSTGEVYEPLRGAA